MQVLDQAGFAALEFCPQQLPEQAVVAVPLAAAVKRDHEQVPGFQLLEDSPGSLPIQDRVAEWPGHPVQHRGAGEERHFRA